MPHPRLPNWIPATVIALLFCLAPALSCGGGGGGSPTLTPSGGATLTVTAPLAPSSYRIDGSENPTLSLQRGQTYTFSLSTAGHPFYIMSVQGTNTGNAYSTGVTGNGGTSGNLTFVVPAGAPSTLYYNCSLHAGMTGTINVTN